jgi:glycosyltransferase involved in cell wall biosynthesis
VHVAIVTFGYPPIPHVSGTRPSNFARELAKLGHRVTVITVDWSTHANPRPPSERVEVVAIDPRRWFPEFSPSAPPFTTEPPTAVPPLFQRARTAARTLGWGPFPSWGRAALRALLEAHRRAPVDVVWAIHGDDSAHEIARRFSRATGIPWVADFKDPWDMSHSRAGVWLQEWATRRRLRTASALTETCQAQGDSDAARFQLPMHLVWTGYDADLMERATPERISDSAFVLAYIGNLSRQNDVDAVARALVAWGALAGTTAPTELHVFANDTSLLRARLAARGVEHLMHEHPFVPRERAYGLMKGASALLLLPATHYVPSGGSIGVKELEYLASGAPVLALGKLLPELDTVTRACPQLFQAESDAAAASWLRAEAAAPGRSRTDVNRPEVAAHAWPAKGSALSAILKGVVAERRSRS